MKRRILIIGILGLLIAGGWYAFTRYNFIYRSNVNPGNEPFELFIHSNTGFDSLYHHLIKEKMLRDPESFLWVAEKMEINDTQLLGGRYIINPGASNYQFIRMIRSGLQTPVRLTINRKDSVEELAGYVATKLEPDSLALIDFLTKEFLPGNEDYSRDNLLTLFIPNTYEFYWNIAPEEFVDRMRKEHEKFWNEERMTQLEAKGLSTMEAYTLASIVEKETIAEEEKPAIAGVYLNRLDKNMHLQADPTVIFAMGDRTIQRVLHRHLVFDSPYNTYLYGGLPPGPICMPAISSIQAVISPEEHNYLFFCARPDEPGKHAFAETLAGHQENARRYQRWANERGLR